MVAQLLVLLVFHDSYLEMGKKSSSPQDVCNWQHLLGLGRVSFMGR